MGSAGRRSCARLLHAVLCLSGSPVPLFGCLRSSKAEPPNHNSCPSSIQNNKCLFLLAAECGCPHPHCQTNRTASSPASKDPGWIGAPLLWGGSPPCRNSQPEGDGVHCLAEGKWKATGSCAAGTYPRVRRPCTPSTSRRTRCAVVEIQFPVGLKPPTLGGDPPHGAHSIIPCRPMT